MKKRKLSEKNENSLKKRKFSENLNLKIIFYTINEGVFMYFLWIRNFS
jgi:hypothetical protein